MDSVFRAAAIYAAVWLIFRIAGRRTLAELTAFDFVLLLIIGEATQQALLGEDFSITNSVLVVATLVFIDIALSLLKVRSETAGKVIDGVPTVVVADGVPIDDRMRLARLSEEDILEAARRLHGLERMDQIKYAVLEVSGGISIVPRKA